MFKSFKPLFLIILVVLTIQLVLTSIQSSMDSKNTVSMGTFLADVKAEKLIPTAINYTPQWSTVVGTKDGNTFTAEGRVTDDDLAVLRAFAPTETLVKPGLFTELLMSLLPTLILIGLLLFFLTRAGKKNPIFAHGKVNLGNFQKPTTKFSDVAGCDESKEEVQEVVDFLKNPKKAAELGGRSPKGVLLVGPPGTGKTLLAKAMAGEAECPFLATSGSDFIEMLAGTGASRIRDLFEKARKQAPCIIFIDEIDAIGRSRTSGSFSGSNDERDQTLNALLVEMDGFAGTEGVVIVAATNRANILDEALLRAGRFDRQVTVPLPDLKGREAILKVHAPKFKLSSDVDMLEVSRQTTGFSGAELQNLLNEAALHASRKNKSSISMHEIVEAKEKIRWGRERRVTMSTEEKRVVAVHEAGHALVQALLDSDDIKLHKVTIIPRGQSLGSTMMTPQRDLLNYSEKQLRNQLACLMGGRIAEELIIKQITSGASGDIQTASNIARRMVYDLGMSDLNFFRISPNIQEPSSQEYLSRADNRVEQILNAEYSRTKDLLKEHLAKLEIITEELLAKETIDGQFVYDLVKK